MLQQLTERVYVAPGGTNVGVVLAEDGRAVLVDTGLNDGHARKVLRAIRDDLRTDVRAIFTTHGHGDHFGANRFVVQRTDARVYAPDLDEIVLRHPLMQTVLLFGGADPVDTIRTRFLLVDDSPVDGILEPGGQQLEGVDFHVVSLAGHSLNQMGLIVEGVFFCADVVLPEATLEKYRIPYLYGLTEHLDALEYALTVECTAVVPGHGPIEASMAGPVEHNRAVIERTITALLNVLETPKTADAACQDLFKALDVPVVDEGGYFLLRPTVSAYLSHLHRVGDIVTEVNDKTVVWRRT
jgi:glyoxylase-like metal-dependent hydrolase (beta-lactamase superfamily II)